MTIRVGESRCHRVTAWSRHPSAWYAFLVCSHRGQCVVYMRSQCVWERFECISVCGMRYALFALTCFVLCSPFKNTLASQNLAKPKTPYKTIPGSPCFRSRCQVQLSTEALLQGLRHRTTEICIACDGTDLDQWNHTWDWWRLKQKCGLQKTSCSLHYRYYIYLHYITLSYNIICIPGSSNQGFSTGKKPPTTTKPL